MAQENISKSIDIVKDLKFVPLSTEPVSYTHLTLPTIYSV